MNFRLLINKKLVRSCLIVILASMFISYFYFDSLSSYNSFFDISRFNMRELFLYAYGNLDPGSVKLLFPLILFLYPLLLLVYYLGEDMQNFYRTNAKYVFIRTQNRTSWSIMNLIRLFVNTILFYLFQDFGTLLVGLIKGLQISLPDVQAGWIIFATQVVSSFFLLLVINLFALFIKVTYSYVIVFSLCFFSFASTGMIYEYAPDFFPFVKWLPTSQFILGWHDLSKIQDFQSKMDIPCIQGFHPAFSFIYLLIGILILSVAFIVRTNQMDIY